MKELTGGSESFLAAQVHGRGYRELVVIRMRRAGDAGDGKQALTTRTESLTYSCDTHSVTSSDYADSTNRALRAMGNDLESGSDFEVVRALTEELVEQCKSIRVTGTPLPRIRRTLIV